MSILFAKAHGARNDFLLTWSSNVPRGADMAGLARAICDRNTGIGADGWIRIVSPAENAHASIELWNSDGSTSAISGNGTRCVAAWLVFTGIARDFVRITTGAGVKTLMLIERELRRFSFEMNMGRATVEDLHATVQGHDAAIIDVGNPQCAIFVDDFNLDWAKIGASIERDPRFPHRTNVSFIKVLDRHNLSVRFFERGAGVTMSSGTGSTGSAVAAVARGFCESPVTVETPAGPLKLRWEGDEILLAGPAEIVGAGEFYWPEHNGTGESLIESR